MSVLVRVGGVGHQVNKFEQVFHQRGRDAGTPIMLPIPWCMGYYLPAPLTPACRQNDGQTPVKNTTFLQLLLRAVMNMLLWKFRLFVLGMITWDWWAVFTVTAGPPTRWRSGMTTGRARRSAPGRGAQFAADPRPPTQQSTTSLTSRSSSPTVSKTTWILSRVLYIVFGWGWRDKIMRIITLGYQRPLNPSFQPLLP